ncbi:type VII secretion-associated serine protease mycosin [Micromonospora sp. CA-263727]|uniref:type VII secretion-associated serine protease mycosin n=1 Tax=Micromonospora sp. CA-263727 TaxID=3239967 RepID=UPI003D8CF1F0
MSTSAPLATIPTPVQGTSSFPNQNSLQIRKQQWHLKYLATSKAHQISQGEGVTVAVLDTGVHPHPDLRNNLLPGSDVIARRGGDGWQDNDGHGTAMAGLIAANSHNTSGALGIAPKANILPIRFKLANSEGTAEDLSRAIDYAVRGGASVISISSGGEPDVDEQKAIQAATSANVVVVAAAGNKPSDQEVRFPAAYSGVVAVGGVDRDGKHADVSVRGAEVDVVAPAVEIYSTNSDGGYRSGTGTSGAAAIVAGAVALIRAKYPYLPADEVVHRLTATAVDKGPPGRDDQYGYGVIDLVAALTADVPPRGFESVPATAQGGGGPTTAAADRPRGDGERAATVRGLVTLGVLLAAGGGWALFVRRRRRSDDPPPRITR